MENRTAYLRQVNTLDLNVTVRFRKIKKTESGQTADQFLTHLPPSHFAPAVYSILSAF